MMSHKAWGNRHYFIKLDESTTWIVFLEISYQLG